MNLLIFGATGRTGKLVVQKAIQDGHTVTAIVRDTSAFSDSGAKLVQGTPYDSKTVDDAMADCDAVICTLNVSRTSDNPWSKLRSPKDLISTSIKNALAAMQKNGVKRIITLSVLGVRDSKKSLPFLVRFFLYTSNIKYAMLDHGQQEVLLEKSSVNWTAIRLPILTDTDGEANVLVNMKDNTKLNRSINRESLARFILNIVDDANYYKKIISVSNA